jgi:voltage-gated hydrogen channel 1
MRFPGGEKADRDILLTDMVGSYFKSTFHIFDAVVIVTAFVVDVLLSGPLEEAGSIIIILRLWRVFKIIEEFSAGAADEVEELAQKVSHLEEHLKNVERENDALRRRLEGDGNGRVNSHY